MFKVEHLITQRVEAMKIIVPDSSEPSEANQRFLREIQLQARLEHPNIVAVHNAFWQDGHICLIMELISGHSLRTLLDRGRLPLAACIDYASQALAALTHAHEHGIIHRDISPANMVVTADGTLKMLDFGLAKAAADLCLTPSGAVIGSLYYVAPEQVTGRAPVDARSDIYSLGAVLYEMVTHVKPFKGESAFSLMLAHVSQTPAAPSELTEGVPLKLSEVILKALETDPNKRFQSAEKFRVELNIIDYVGAPSSDPNTKPEAQSISSANISFACSEVQSPIDAPPGVLESAQWWGRKVASFGWRNLGSQPIRIAGALVLATALSYPWGHRASGPRPAITISAVNTAVRGLAESSEAPLTKTVSASAPSRPLRMGSRPDPKTKDKKKTGNRFSRFINRIRHPHAAATQGDPPLTGQP